MTLTSATVDTCDPRKLAEAIAAKCEKMVDADSDNCPTIDAGEDCVLSNGPAFAAALDAVLGGMCHPICIHECEDCGDADHIRAAARALIERGVKLEVDE